MRCAWLVPILGLLGCARHPEPVPLADEVAEACASADWEDGSASRPLRLPADCVEVLFAHVGVTQDGEDVREVEPYAHAVPLWEGHPRALLARALYYLWAVDAGSVSDLEERGMVDAELVEALQSQRSTGRVSTAAYEYVANSIDELRLTSADGRDARARYPGMQTGLVELYLDRGQGDAASLAGTLFHEARHRWGPGHVRCRDLPIDPVYPDEPLSHDSSCDRDLSGSFGFEAGWLWQVSLHGGPDHEDDAWTIYRRVRNPWEE